MLGVLLAVAGCDQGSGTVTGDWLEAPGCDGVGTSRRFEPYHIELAVMGAELGGDALMVRFAPDASVPYDSDQLFVIIEGYRAARDEIATTGALTRPLADARTQVPGSAQAQAGLALIGHCAYGPAPMLARGTATFTRLGSRQGQNVTGELRFDVVDERDGTTLGANFVADFDFSVEVGEPYRAFSPRDL